MKTTIGHRIFLILLIIAPLLYLLMYFPIWNGKELVLWDAITIALFAFQCVSIAFATAHLFLDIFKIRCCEALTVIFYSVSAISIILTCFVGFFFELEIFAVPWFPAQR